MHGPLYIEYFVWPDEASLTLINFMYKTLKLEMIVFVCFRQKVQFLLLITAVLSWAGSQSGKFTTFLFFSLKILCEKTEIHTVKKKS